MIMAVLLLEEIWPLLLSLLPLFLCFALCCAMLFLCFVLPVFKYVSVGSFVLV